MFAVLRRSRTPCERLVPALSIKLYYSDLPEMRPALQSRLASGTVMAPRSWWRRDFTFGVCESGSLALRTIHSVSRVAPNTRSVQRVSV